MISLHFSHLNFSGKKQSAKYVIFIELIKLIEEFFTPGISWRKRYDSRVTDVNYEL